MGFYLDRNNERNRNLNNRLNRVKSSIDNKLKLKLKPETMKLKVNLARTMKGRQDAYRNE